MIVFVFSSGASGLAVSLGMLLGGPPWMIVALGSVVAVLCAVTFADTDKG